MCYSAQIWADYRQYAQAHDAESDIARFVKLLWSRLDDDRIKVTLAMENAFEAPPRGPVQFFLYRTLESLRELVLIDPTKPQVGTFSPTHGGSWST